METLIMHPKTKEQSAALKAVAKVLKVEFKAEEDTYDPAFVAEILKGEKARKEGKKGLRINTTALWK